MTQTAVREITLATNQLEELDSQARLLEQLQGREALAFADLGVAKLQRREATLAVRHSMRGTAFEAMYKAQDRVSDLATAYAEVVKARKAAEEFVSPYLDLLNAAREAGLI